MEITYELTQGDFLDSLIAHRNGSAYRKWSFRLVFSSLFVSVGLCLLMLAERPHDESLRASLAPWIALGVIWAVVMWARPRWWARNQYTKQPGVQGPRTVIIDAEGVHSCWNGGSSDIEWKNYIRYVESKRHFLLYSSPVIFNTLPKRALTPEQVSEFRKLLAQNISKTR
jgi:hypothetical protein